MGMTGAGKSSFITLCTQEPLEIVGHGLSSCTSQVMMHTMTCNGQTVHLIDTPGFNDTVRSDGETLQELAFWLAAAHEREFHLSGIIYLHPINANRLQGSGVRSLNAFKRMVGESNYHGVILATTRWDEIAPEQMHLASQREQQLRTKGADILQKGGRVVSLSAGRHDAMRIVAHVAGRRRDERLTLAFQRQLVDEGRAIYETDVGRVLFEQLETDHQQLQGRVEGSQAEILKLIESGKQDHLTEVLEFQTETTNSLKPLEDDIERMRKRMNDIREQWEERLRKEKDALAEAEKESEEKIKQKSEELTRLHAQLRSPSPSSGVGRNGSRQWSSPQAPNFLEPSDGYVPRSTRSASPSSTYSTSSSGPRSLTPNSAITEAGLLREIEELGHQQDVIRSWKQIRPDSRRHAQQPGHNAAWSVVGTGLAVAQVVAAIACTVM
ncbi:hypothetical protein K458DRAFT_398613 [Lentithecium fluviatile CBS 122367]|uniref:G domain-containing protein n=1 Tax=Lentithecium fluviatile CBS 122367 TaxID=1168545 RepID=A0A6G1JJE5_9PLEO|nr:hypothetical protein K458DRAFT_398613 [Lentithecium fluviatile CBS 122367]